MAHQKFTLKSCHCLINLFRSVSTKYFISRPSRRASPIKNTLRNQFHASGKNYPPPSAAASSQRPNKNGRQEVWPRRTRSRCALRVHANPFPASCDTGGAICRPRRRTGAASCERDTHRRAIDRRYGLRGACDRKRHYPTSGRLFSFSCIVFGAPAGFQRCRDLSLCDAAGSRMHIKRNNDPGGFVILSRLFICQCQNQGRSGVS